LGKRADSGFKAEAWVACVEAVMEVTPYIVTVKQCKNKAEAQKALWKDLCYLRDQSGFGWNEQKKRVEAPDNVWDTMIEASNIYLYIPVYLTNYS
jgi:hypothetical protein